MAKLTEEQAVKLMEFAAEAMIPQAALRRMEMEQWDDFSMRALCRNLSLSVASARMWEEHSEIPRQLTWRERIRCLFGGEIVTQLNYRNYHNCPHIDLPESTHYDWMMPRG